MDVGELSERLGRYAIGASRDLEAVAELAAGERLEAVVVAVWKRRGYVWAIPRSSIVRAEPVDDGLRLVLADGEATLTDFLPPDRRDELAAVL